MTHREIEESDEVERQRVCAILETVVDRFASDSDEALAIRDAALAYTIVHQHERLKKAYDKLRIAFGGDLTSEMKDDLRRNGIDPDDFEEGEDTARKVPGS